MEDVITIDTKKLRTVLEYVLDSEKKHFEEWVDNGYNKEDHIYYTALVVYNYLPI